MLYRLEAGNWTKIAPLMATHRTPKQCRERWYQNLKPDLSHTPLTEQEQAEVMRLVRDRGHKWASIARSLGPHRSDNMVKNWWNGENNRRSKSKAKIRRIYSDGKNHHFDIINQRRLPLPLTPMHMGLRIIDSRSSANLATYNQNDYGGYWSLTAPPPTNPIRIHGHGGEPLRPAMPSPVNSQMSNTAPSLVTDRASKSPQPQQVETPRMPHLPPPSPSHAHALVHTQQESFAMASVAATRRSGEHPTHPSFNSMNFRHEGSLTSGNTCPMSSPETRLPKDKMRVQDILN